MSSKFEDQIFTILDLATASRQNVLFEGEPGTAKSSIIRQYGEDRGRFTLCFVGSTKADTDFTGTPHFEAYSDDDPQEVTAFSMLRWFKDFIVKYPDGILFLDELKNVAPDIQAAMLTLVQDREIDGVKLPDTVLIVAATNSVEDSSDGWLLSPAMANRFCHYPWDPSVEEFIQAFPLGYSKKELSETERSVRADMAAFMSVNTLQVHKMPKTAIEKGGAWPSRRSWTNAAEMIGKFPEAKDSEQDKMFNTLRSNILAGFVGSAVAVDYYAWLMNYEMPDPRGILNGEIEIDWDDIDGNIALRIAYSMISLCLTDTEAWWQKVIDVLTEMAASNSKDVAAAVVMTVLENHPEGASFPQALILAYGNTFQLAGIK